MKLIKMPRLSANEDEIKLISINFKNGDFVNKGDEIFIIETSKTQIEINAISSGYFISNPDLIEGQVYPVGYKIGLITDSVINNSNNELYQLLKNDNEKNDIINLKNKILNEKSSKLIKTTQNSLNYSYNRVIILGAGAHARQVADACLSSNFSVIGFVDNYTEIGIEIYMGIKCIGTDSDLPRLIYDNKITGIVNGLGFLNEPIKRIEIINKIKNETTVKFITVICKESFVSPTAYLEEGVVILRGVIIGPNVIIGKYSIINQGVNISHDSIIGSNCNLAPGAILAGSVEIGNNCLIGMGSTIYTNVKISDNKIVKNGENIFTNQID